MRLSAVLNPIGHAHEARLAHVLRSVPLLKDLPGDDILDIWRHLDQVKAEADAVICRRGDPGDSFFVVQSGRVVVCLGLGEDSIVIRELGPGDQFGEMALITGAPRTADVIAVEDTVLWSLSRHDFAQLTSHSVPLLQALNRELCNRVSLLTLQLEDLEARTGMRGGSVAGMRIGPYRVVQQIGSGGMAVVFSAVHAETEETVALKVLPAAWGEATEFRQRFEREAAVLQHLSHPNVVRVHGAGEEASQTGNAFYMAMEWLPHALDRVLRAQFPDALPLSTALGITRQVAEALHAVHELEIVHRDVKPSNILLRADGTPVLTDFGLVADVAGVLHAQRLTAPNVVMGTADYMSPEQVNGEPLDGRSDVYSLGVVLYELLCGQVPFAGREPYQTLRAHVEEPPPPLPESVPTPVAEIVTRTLQKAPVDRFPTAQAFADALADVAEGSLARSTRRPGAHCRGSR